MRSLIVAALVLAPAPLLAKSPEAPAQPVAAAKPSEGDKLVCRREHVSGSNIPGKKVCHRKRDIDQAAVETRETFQQFQGAGHTNGN